MSDFKLPDLPSDEDLGIDDDDLEEFIEDEGSELSAAEMQALLGETPKPKPPPKKPAAANPASAEGERPVKKRSAREAGAKKPRWWHRKKKPQEQPAATESPAPVAPPEEPAEPKPPRPAEPEAPRTKWRGPATLAFLVLTAWMSSSARSVPSPQPANAPDTVFSSARAMSHVVEIARTAHPPGSPEHDRVRLYIMDELRDLGFEPAVQTATSMIRGGTLVRAATARNIVARMPGTGNTGAVLVTAHYDGRELARAAGDDGSGVASILESLRALRGSAPLRNDLIVLITDAEELGLLGARAFVNDHPWMNDVQAVLSIEMRGSGGPSIMFETGAEYGWIARAYKAGAPLPFANSLTYEIYKSMPNDTDFTPFREAGKQGLNFAAIGRAHVYHQVFDNPENLHEGTLQHHGLNTLSMIKQLGHEDLTSVTAPDVVYFSMPLLGLVIYPEGWIWPLTALVILLWVGVLLTGRRKGVRPWGPPVGLAVAGISGVGAYFAADWLAGWLTGFHPEVGALHGSAFHSEGWYVVTVVAFSLALTVGCYNLARRWFSSADLLMGISMVPVLLVVGLTYFVPMGAHTVQWPAIAFMVAALAGALLPASGRMGEVRWLVLLLMALPVLGMLTSLIELLWLVVSVQLLAALAGMIVLTLFLLIPSLDALREPNSWWAPVAAILFGGAFLGVGLLQAAPSAERPLPSTLIYALDGDSGEASWATQASLGEDDAARAWAESQTSVTFGENQAMDTYGGRSDAYAMAPAPTVEVPAPSVAVVAYSAAAGGRAVRVAVRSELGAELLIFRMAEGVQVVAVNGRAIPTTGRDGAAIESLPTRIEHWGRPDTMVTLDLRMAASDTLLTFTLMEHSLRPGELLGAEVFQRPPELTANIVRQSDRAMIRRTVSLPLTALVQGSSPGITASAVDGVGQAGGEVTDSVLVSPDTTGDEAAPMPDTTTVPDTLGTAAAPDTTITNQGPRR